MARGRRVDQRGVVAPQVVVVVPAEQLVVATLADEDVGARPADEEVVAVALDRRVGAEVVALVAVAGDEVGPGIAEQHGVVIRLVLAACKQSGH